MTPPAMNQNWNMVPALQCHIYPDFEFANVFDPDEEDFDKIGQHSPLPIPKEIFQETVSPSEAGASANGEEEEEEEEDKEQNREDDESTGIVMEKMTSQLELCCRSKLLQCDASVNLPLPRRKGFYKPRLLQRKLPEVR